MSKRDQEVIELQQLVATLEAEIVDLKARIILTEPDVMSEVPLDIWRRYSLPMIPYAHHD
jgi:hypothetical protein